MRLKYGNENSNLSRSSSPSLHQQQGLYWLDSGGRQPGQQLRDNRDLRNKANSWALELK